MKNQYVILTGSKNNAGEFLIKYRAMEFKKLRPGRYFIDFNAWEEFDSKKLQVVNESRALILVGGLSLQKNMQTAVYSMTTNLNDIKVQIITMGIGWEFLTGK
jgi:hypothetical protein